MEIFENEKIKNYFIIIVYMYEYKQFILTKNQSIVFEIVELIALFLVVIFYIYNNNIILTIAYLVPFIEHIRQVVYVYRQDGGSYIDCITFFYFVLILLYSISISDKLSIVASSIGIIVHIITMTTQTCFSQLVSYNECQNYLFH